MHDHEETVLLVYRESHALDRRSLHAILARVAEFIDMFERILVEAARSGQVRFGMLSGLGVDVANGNAHLASR